MGSCNMECCLLDKKEVALRNSLQLRLPAQEQATQISQQPSMTCQLDLVVLLYSFFFKKKGQEGRRKKRRRVGESTWESKAEPG